MSNAQLLVTIPARLALRAEERPTDPALTLVGGGQLTFAEWDRRSTAVARGLVLRGVTPGDRVTLVADLPHLLSFAVAYVGVQKAGATPVPVTRTSGRHHLERVHKAAGSVGVIGDAIGAALDGWSTQLSELAAAESSVALPSDLAPADIAEILYTSGTTGVPKGVLVSHENLLYTHTASRPDRAKRVVVHALSPGTQVGQGLLVQALDGTPHHVVALAAFSAEALLRAVAEYRATHLVIVPVMALSLIQHGAVPDLDVSSVRLVRNTSAPIAPAALERLASMFESAAIEDHYSTTEAWPARTRLRFDPSHPGSVGRNQGPAEIRIVDDADSVLPAGEAGYVEMRLAGAPSRRYADDESDSTFRPEGWVRTGDLAYVDADGFLYLTDRAGDTVNAGGVKISTLAAERVVQSFPGVVEAAVVGLPSPTLGEYPVAAIRTGGELDLDELGTFLEERLGSSAPKRLVVVDDFPRTGLGKVIKRELRDVLAAKAAPADHTVAEGDPLVARLRGFWADALGGDLVEGVDFVAQGGNSLSAARVVGRVREELGRAVGHRALYNAADVSEFAVSVRQAPEWKPDGLGPIGRAEPEGDEAS